jgi:hypothetical protein
MSDGKVKSADNNSPWQKFEDAMRKIVKVPHSEVKAQLDAEKEAKKRKRTRKSKLAAVHALNDRG